MAVYEALAQGLTTLLLHWLGVFLFLSPWPQIGHCQQLSPPEVVIPLRVTDSDNGMNSSGWVCYSLHFGGQRHIVHMKPKKVLVSRSLSVFTYTDQGALVEDQPFVRHDCYYQGYVEGDAESLVALSTCLGGLQGVLHINDIAYEIKPKRHSATFEHLVYKMDHEETSFPTTRCALTDDIVQEFTFPESDNSTLMQSDYLGWWTHRRYLELAVVVDQERFFHRESNVSKVQEEVITVLNVISTFYITLDIDLFLCGLEIWNEGNHVNDTTINSALWDFCKWKLDSLNPRLQHDVAHLIMKHDFGIYLGLAYYGAVCNYRYNCGVEGYMHDRYWEFSVTFAHEIGHNLGMLHDDYTCECEYDGCIMYAELVPAITFSNCSYASYVRTDFRTTCMREPPSTDSIFSLKHCGNGVVEEGEQCDCGNVSSCENDPCCLPNCSMKPGATCAFGLCCKDCQLVPSGEVCRESGNECDLPEWCNGTSHECPVDVYVQAGVRCMGVGYCHGKRCNIRDEQCKQIFGEVSKSANQSCYSHVNTQGDRFGNCGIKATRYVKCDITDVLCGRIQCENVTKIPLMEDHTTAHWTHFNGVNCWSTDYHLGITIPDVGMVNEGTECGPEHICLDGHCIPLSVLKDLCEPKICNDRGICNDKHHCHCDPGWDPPYCLEKGWGGSVDSGPPPRNHEEKKGPRKTSVMIFLWVLVLISLCWLYFFLWMKRGTPQNEVQRAEPSPEQE
ncbi:disintegrin and metalloproteinase domain-containing protein 25-like [Tupaia chinensis]|uniref:disintegrin and metalloproteinase domain-containing protein 25-like n=1 Tax=Tupaia chinensis TaxID=246437 RepID=UPI0003C90D39|nr:disintegrin and metalloproteinase domain-containing protein 25-like [Tupaia chinensis]